MVWSEILEKAIALQQEKIKWRRELKKAEDEVIGAVLRGDKEAVISSLKNIVTDEKKVRKVADTLTAVPLNDRRLVKSLWKSLAGRYSLREAEDEERWTAEEAALRREIVKIILKNVFGGLSTQEDEELASERLKEAIEKAETIEEVIDACRTYLLVKANRLAQEMDVSEVDEEIQDAVKEEIARVFRKSYEDELRKEIDKRLAEGKDDIVTKGLFALWVKEKGGRFEISKLYQLLVKTRDWKLVADVLKEAK